MRTKGSAEVLETRRRIAARMLQQKYGVVEVAKALGVAKSSVSRWKKAFEQGGWQALCAKPQPGAKPRLGAQQRAELIERLLAGARAAGFANELWTCRRVGQVIQRQFGVRYSSPHVWRLLRQLGWSCQRPEQRAKERNEESIRRWRKRDWPRIKKELSTAS